jgi:hypothetical protein
MDEIEQLNNRSGMFKNRLACDKAAVLGMSMGGIASALACTQDSRFVAVINIDGGLYGDIIDRRISVPTMFISSERYRRYGEFFITSVDTDAYALVISGADHQNFSDGSILNPDGLMIGSIEGNRAIEITRRCVISFLDSFVSEEPEGKICRIADQYPEIQCESKGVAKSDRR